MMDKYYIKQIHKDTDIIEVITTKSSLPSRWVPHWLEHNSILVTKSFHRSYVNPQSGSFSFEELMEQLQKELQ